MKKNRLANEKSPYLLQHKNNPVHWYPWGEEAFAEAKKSNKIIFLSVGYSTCHWCHVMEEDSFVREEVAEVLNKYFISIKVDREERPDVDRIYMDAVVAMTGQGGWPLSVFLTPDLKPFFGATFVPRANFIQLLKNIQNVWETQKEKIIESSEQLTVHLQGIPPPLEKGGRGDFSNVNFFEKALHHFEVVFDEVHGGFGGAPKFPKSMDCSLLLRIHRRTGNARALQMAEVTLEAMARGGMYDHLGGGFHRYSTDNIWLVPHYEKMLYDNALLSFTYLEAFQVTQKPLYAEVAREILDYVLRDMTSPEGGFYSAEDADSEGEEGKFYVWSEEELKSLLTKEEFTLFSKVYPTMPLSLAKPFDWSIKKDPLLKRAHEKLFKVREKRIHPGKDDKILTEWNGLMIAAMAKGYQVLGDEKYLKAAQNAAKFISSHSRGSNRESMDSPPTTAGNDKQLFRRYRDNQAAIPAFINDYSFLIHGLLHLYESDSNPTWFELAEELQSAQDQLFWDTNQGGYFFSREGASDLIVRTKETFDAATPSGNSIAALNLLRLYGFTGKPEYREKIEKHFNFLSAPIQSYPLGYAVALMALDYRLGPAKEITVTGNLEDPATKEIRDFLFKTFLPNKVMIFEKQDGPTAVRICENQTCQLPTQDIEEAKSTLLK